MKKVLFLTHYFPPAGGAGVQRSAKFVKHLPSLGWLPVVVTPIFAGENRWTPKDESLLHDVPEQVPVHRVDVSAQDPVAQTEARATALTAVADRLVRDQRPAVIFVTMSPFGYASIAAAVAADHRLPWVADLRDPWALDEFQVYRTRWHRAAERRRMEAALRTASAVIMNTPEAARRFRETFPSLAKTPVVSITNGYDAEDFEGVPSSVSFDRFTIVHSGYFHAELGLTQRRRRLEYLLLGRTEAGVDFLSRSHYYLLKALERWLVEDPSIAQRVRVVCLGSATPTDERLVRESSAAALFEFTGYRPHSECLRSVRNADLLFLPMHQLPLGRRATIVPGKTYEYMASRRPILAAIPDGDAMDYLQAYGTADIVKPDDTQGIHAALERAFRRWSSTQPPPQGNELFLKNFERRNLTQELAHTFDRACLP